MPVSVDSSRSSRDHHGNATSPIATPPSQIAEQSSRCLAIGLINNMAESAFNATERQFISLLDAASEGILINLSLYALRGIPNGSNGNHRGSRYSSVETLWEKRLDGLIVTGREPMTPNLRDEPYWGSFAQVLEWARENTHSTVWSCLAAHAAVLHMDDIGRCKSGDKHFGVFECTNTFGHPLTAGISPSFQVPHSRWNGIAEEGLAARGYLVLSRDANGEVDTFIKEGNSLFVFFQGHPEYDSDTLLREYRRDVGRYLKHEANTYPSMPRAYFDGRTEDALAALQEKAASDRSRELLVSLTTALEQKKIENTWHTTATHIYRNWLEYISERKYASCGDGLGNAECSLSH
jgi:homoserine O-succinyltransferase/O-acetyltransferase